MSSLRYSAPMPDVVHVAGMLYGDMMPTNAYNTWVLEGRVLARRKLILQILALMQHMGGNSPK